MNLNKLHVFKLLLTCKYNNMKSENYLQSNQTETRFKIQLIQEFRTQAKAKKNTQLMPMLYRARQQLQF